jgi:putative two-component system response regulator
MTATTAERILIVDDEEQIRNLLRRLLESHGYSCATAGDSAEARRLLESDAFTLLLSDLNMPGESGIDLANDVLERFPDVAVVMVTGVDDRRAANAALDRGAYGYVLKPFKPNELAINVANALRRRALEIENRQQREGLEQVVRQRTSDLSQTIEHLRRSESELRRLQEEAIRRLSFAAEFRNQETGRHIVRMSLYCQLLGRLAGLDDERVEILRIASPMHDVGKIGIPDAVLLKPVGLTEDERRLMQTHTTIGHRMLVGSGFELLDLAATLALTHHERIDGAGYPQGLAGEAIPVEGRIAAIADVFDALTSDRVYRPAFSHESAREMLLEGRGTHFDPALLDLFLGAWDDVLAIRSRSERP